MDKNEYNLRSKDTSILENVSPDINNIDEVELMMQGINDKSDCTHGAGDPATNTNIDATNQSETAAETHIDSIGTNQTGCHIAATMNDSTSEILSALNSLGTGMTDLMNEFSKLSCRVQKLEHENVESQPITRELATNHTQSSTIHDTNKLVKQKSETQQLA